MYYTILPKTYTINRVKYKSWVLTKLISQKNALSHDIISLCEQIK